MCRTFHDLLSPPGPAPEAGFVWSYGDLTMDEQTSSFGAFIPVAEAGLAGGWAPLAEYFLSEAT